MSKQRILYVEAAASAGGSLFSLLELLGALDPQRYEPLVLFLHDNPMIDQYQAQGIRTLRLNPAPEQAAMARPVPAQTAKRDIAARLDQTHIYLGNSYRIAKDFYTLTRFDQRKARQIARIIRDEQVALVHHNNSLHGNRVSVLGARLAGTPQVCHVRMFNRCSWLERSLGRFVDSFIYISKAVEAYYQSIGIPARKGRVVYNPVGAGAFASVTPRADVRRELGLADGDFVACNVGRIVPWKGQDDFLHAMATVVQREPRAKALIVGKPPPTPDATRYYAALQRLVEELALQEHVIFTGFRRDIPSLMSAADVNVHSASEPEPFGRVIVEAMLSGAPVIATKAGGPLDIVDDGADGPAGAAAGCRRHGERHLAAVAAAGTSRSHWSFGESDGAAALFRAAARRAGAEHLPATFELKSFVT